MRTIFGAMVMAAVVVLMFVSSRSMETEGHLPGRPAPEISGGTWFNAPATTLSQLRGKVVLIEFWTFGCYNCRNTLPYVKQWHEKYSGPRFGIIGVHTPEFESEKNPSNLKERIARLGIKYPVVTDNDYKTWNAYDQKYWPAMYLIDRKGIVRYVHIGEGEYDVIENEIVALMNEG